LNNFEVIFYEKENGVQPAKEFLLNLDIKMSVKVTYILQKIERSSSELKEPLSKHIEDGIFELRTSYNYKKSKIIYFFSPVKK